MTTLPDPPEVLTALLAEPVMNGLREWLAAIYDAGREAAATPPPPAYITPEEAADILRCSVAHVRRLYKRGDLTRHGGRRVLLDRQEVVAHAARIA